jgi:hypothetical protein
MNGEFIFPEADFTSLIVVPKHGSTMLIRKRPQA